MVLEPVDPNARFHERRASARRRRKLRRTAFLFALVIAAILGGLTVWVTARGTGSHVSKAAQRGTTNTVTVAQQKSFFRRRSAASTSPWGWLRGGQAGQYVSLKDEGLNTIELDVKDENGAVAFSSPEAPLASEIGAAGNFYNPARSRRQVHADGIYLIGRVAVFEDPVLSARRPDMAIQRPTARPGSTTTASAGRTSTTSEVWEYNVSIAKAAAKAGFDEIQFDYIRFPSDGADLERRLAG